MSIRILINNEDMLEFYKQTKKPIKSVVLYQTGGPK